MISKRAILKGAGGAAALLARQNSEASPRAQAPSYLPPTTGDGLLRGSELDPLSGIKQALRAKAAEERSRLNDSLQRQIEALHDLRSISPAYRRYRLAQLMSEQEKVRQRFYEFCERL